jgi:hypothetical protein
LQKLQGEQLLNVVFVNFKRISNTGAHETTEACQILEVKPEEILFKLILVLDCIDIVLSQ